MDIIEMKRIKEEYGFTLQMISDASQVPMSTVLKIFSNSIKTPRNSTLAKLSSGILKLELEAVKREENERLSRSYVTSLIDDGMVAETNSFGKESSARNVSDVELLNLEKSLQEKIILSKKHPGEYTIDDLKDMPEDYRYEVCNGNLIKMESPSALHQMLAGEIFAQIREYIRKNKGTCIPYISPLDVQFDEEGKDVFEPDVFVVCKGAPTYKRVVGVPDFIIEIISPSNMKYDMQTKLTKYTEYGVREYWIIDPIKQRIIVNELEKCDITIYTFEDKVPVGIYEGKLKIDFLGMPEYIMGVLLK